MRLPIQLLSLTLSILPSTLAIFADEAYTVDYQHQLLGIPLQHTTFFHRPRKDDKASLLYTFSDSGVVGAVNPGTGSIVWRHYLAANTNRTFGGEHGVQGFLRAAEGEGTVVSAVGGYVNAWDARTGREKWYNEFSGCARDLEVLETAGEEVFKDSLMLFEEPGKGIVRRLSGKNGDVVWEHAMEGSDVPFQVSTNVKSVFVISLHGARGGYNLKITTLDPVSGKKLDEYTLASKADVHGVEDVIFVGANIAAPIIAWTDKALKSVKVNILGSSKVHSLALAAASEAVEKVIIHAPHLVQSQPHFLVHSQSATSHWAEVYHIDLAAGTIVEAYHLPKLPGKGAFSTSSQEANVYFTRHTEDEVIIVASSSHGVLGRFPTTQEEGSGAAVHGVSEVVAKGATKAGTSQSFAVRSAIVTTEDRWDMVRNGAPAWSRAEGLAGVVAAAWAEIPEPEDLARTLEAEAHSNSLSAYIHRVNRHINDLQYLPDYLQNIPKRLLSSIVPADSSATDGTPLMRDSFGFRKLVIIATERGRLYALDTADQGKIIWSRKAFDMPPGERWDVKGIYVDNLKGHVTVRGSEGEYVIVGTETGVNIETMWRGSMPAVQSTALVNSASGPWFLPIGPDGKPGSVAKEWAPANTLVVRGQAGQVKGVTFIIKDDLAVPEEVWSFQPPPGQRILSVTARSAHDPVANIGRVLGDRTVLYKYLNPNTIVVTAVSDAASTASLYLIDSVSGEVLYSTTHESIDSAQPISVVISENWFAYSLWGDLATDPIIAKSTKGNQLFISEMFESRVSNDRGPLGSTSNYSALQPSSDTLDEPALPHVINAAFFVPQPISHLSVTQTRQGITTRQLLCTLPSTNSILAISRQLLDPRRPVGRDPTAGELEEGLSRYEPVIAFDPKMTITHKREILGVRNVITTPALLESTSLVFAYGIDVFGTRVAPSLAFDILGKDFNRVALVITVAALAVGVFVLAPMVRRKQINARWKTA